MVLGNFVKFEEGTPKKLRLTDHRIGPTQIPDPITKKPKVLNVLEFDVSEEDGKPISKQWRVTSEKLAQQLWPFLDGNLYRGKLFTITAQGKGFLREYTVKVE